MERISSTFLAAGFDLEKHNQNVQPGSPPDGGGEQTVQGMREGWLGQIDAAVPVIYEWGILIFTFLFVVSIIGMIISIQLRHGQWMKWSSTTMLFTFLTVLLLRLGPIFVLTMNVTDITLLLTKSVAFLQEFVLYAAIVAMLIGIFYRSFYKIHKHDGYDRWSKGLFVGAAVLVILSFVTPFIMGGQS